MNIEQFNELVAFVEKELEIPPGIVFAEGYEDWQTRLRLARILSGSFQQYDPAIELFLSAVESKPLSFEQFEDIVWALRDLFVCIYHHEKDPVKAIKYINQAITMIELDPTKKFTFFVRGELWCWRWVAMRDLGDVNTAVAEANEKINFLPADAPPTDNSYVYYGYYFIASLAYAEQEFEIAFETLKQALPYYPTKEIQSELQVILNNVNLSAKESYEKVLQLTRQQANWTI